VVANWHSCAVLASEAASFQFFELFHRPNPVLFSQNFCGWRWKNWTLLIFSCGLGKVMMTSLVVLDMSMDV
jgi:hypothetical protein